MSCNKKYKHKIANSLLRNYVFLAFSMTLLIIITSIIVGMFAFFLFFNTSNVMSEPEEIMMDDYTLIDTSTIESSGGFVEVIDKNNNVVYTRGTNPNPKSHYSLEDYNKIILSSQNLEDGYSYRSSYNKNKDFLLVVAIPESGEKDIHPPKKRLSPRVFIALSLLSGFSIIAIFFIFYSRLSSRDFVKPLELLTEGANRFAKGDYSTRIAIYSENEFGELKDSFNIMAQKIQDEMMLREKSEESRRRLILDISHDLKNPLSSILGYSNLLLEENIPNEDKKKYLEVINNNSQRANELLQDLFDFSKLQSIDFKLTLINSDICEFLREIIAFYIPEFDKNKFDYDFDIMEEPFMLKIDEKHMYRALSNIINNSIKYNPDGTKVKISGKSSKNSFIITIEDNGIGIPASLQHDIFNPFVRVDDSRNSKSGGNGLGLAIAKDIIEKHNGTIELYSDINKGCIFVITLLSENL